MKNEDIHTQLDKLFEEIKALAETNTDEAKQKLTIALDLMRDEHDQLTQ